jgi:chorismate mutase
MDIADWRKKIDELDRRLVELLNERAQAAHEIGKLKRNTRSSRMCAAPTAGRCRTANCARCTNESST